MEKVCGTCQVSKPLEEFNFRDKAKGRRHSFCRECAKVKGNTLYRSSEARRTSVKARATAHKEALREYVYSFLHGKSCVTCGEADPIVLEFDHIDRDTKEYEIGTAIRIGVSFENLQAEMDKCQLLCCNCHRRRTAQQMGWTRPSLDLSLVS